MDYKALPEHMGSHHYIYHYVVPEVDFLISRAYSAASEYNQKGDLSSSVKVLLCANHIYEYARKYFLWDKNEEKSYHGKKDATVTRMWGNRHQIGRAIRYAFSDFLVQIDQICYAFEKSNVTHLLHDTGIASLNMATHLNGLRVSGAKQENTKLFDIQEYIASGWRQNEEGFKALGFVPFDLTKLLPQHIYKKIYVYLLLLGQWGKHREVEGFEFFINIAKKKETDTLPVVSLPLDGRFGNLPQTGYAQYKKADYELITSFSKKKFLENEAYPIWAELPALVKEYRQKIQERYTDYVKKQIPFPAKKAVNFARSDMQEKMNGRFGFDTNGDIILYHTMYFPPVKKNAFLFYSLPEMFEVEAEFIYNDIQKS